MSEKYVNYYIETLTSTLTDCIVRNVSMQANAKISDDVIQEQNKKIEELIGINLQLGNTIQEMKDSNSLSENESVNRLNKELAVNGNTIVALREEIRGLQSLRSEYEKIKSQSTHVDTFRNELIKSRGENKNLQDVIDSLNNKIVDLNAQITELKTPTKKPKKVAKSTEVPANVFEQIAESGQNITRDGGSF